MAPTPFHVRLYSSGLAIGLLLASCGSDSTNNDTSADDAGADQDDLDAAITETQLSGTLGDLGEVQPIVSSFVISNSGETLVYLSSGQITCELLMVEGGKWLRQVDAGTQVVEIVVKGTPKLGTVNVGPAEVNYAPGGMSSSHETGARSGRVTFTRSEPMGMVAGYVHATYASGNLDGTFSAGFCPGGQQY